MWEGDVHYQRATYWFPPSTTWAPKWNSGPQAWWQVTLLTDPSSQPHSSFLYFLLQIKPMSPCFPIMKYCTLMWDNKALYLYTFRLYFWKHFEGYLLDEVLLCISELKTNIYFKGQPSFSIFMGYLFQSCHFCQTRFKLNRFDHRLCSLLTCRDLADWRHYVLIPFP